MKYYLITLLLLSVISCKDTEPSKIENDVTTLNQEPAVEKNIKDAEVNQASVEENHKRKHEETNINGIYTGEGTVGGWALKVKVTIMGEEWSATSNLAGDTEYQKGYVVDKELWDESGMLKLGYVSGRSVHLSGYPEMTKQD